MNYPLGSFFNYQIILDKKSSVLTLVPHSSHLISLLSQQISKSKHKKIYNKFPNQLRKKKKKKINPLQIRIPQNAKQKNIRILQNDRITRRNWRRMRQQHRLLLWSNRRTPPNQTLTPRLQPRPHFRSPSPSLSATRRLRTPPPHLRRALWWILHRQNHGRYRFRQEPTDEVLREKGERKKKKKKRKKESSGTFWSLEERRGKKKEERRIKKKRVRVCVWRRKKEGKRERNKCRVWRIKKKGIRKKKKEMLL